MATGPADDILSDYIDRLRSRLRRMPEAWAVEVVREIGEHLEDMVADLVAAGSSQEDAARSAVAKFGSPEKVGDRLMRERNRRPVILLTAQMVLFSVLIQIDWLSGTGLLSLAAHIGTCLLGISLGLTACYEENAWKWRMQLRTKEEKRRDDFCTAIILVGVVVACTVMGFAGRSFTRLQIPWLLVWAGSVAVAYGLAGVIRKYRSTNLIS